MPNESPGLEQLLPDHLYARILRLTFPNKDVLQLNRSSTSLTLASGDHATSRSLLRSWLIKPDLSSDELPCLPLDMMRDELP